MDAEATYVSNQLFGSNVQLVIPVFFPGSKVFDAPGSLEPCGYLPPLSFGIEGPDHKM